MTELKLQWGLKRAYYDKHMTMYMCELSGIVPPHNSPVRKNYKGWFSLVIESELES